MDSSLTNQAVIDHYSTIAREDPTAKSAHMKKAAEAFGYSSEDLASIPEGANLGLSCGNPLAIAGLKEGETVVDLGSGAGFDVFQAARKVGSTGLAVGIDMSTDMLTRARLNATKASITNVKFVQSPITSIPLESESADCIISNCVINLLSPDEKKVCFGEIFRTLRQGGRLAVSDTLANKPFSGELQSDMGLYVGCVSGASLVSEYGNWLKEVGFEDIMIVDKKIDLNIYKERDGEQPAASCCIPSSKAEMKNEAASSCVPSSSCCSTRQEAENEDQAKKALKKVVDLDFNEWVGSYAIYAVKPNAPKMAN